MRTHTQTRILTTLLIYRKIYTYKRLHQFILLEYFEINSSVTGSVITKNNIETTCNIKLGQCATHWCDRFKFHFLKQTRPQEKHEKVAK